MDSDLLGTYTRELREGWRPLLAVVIGLSSGLVMTSYTIGIMGPHLVAEFGWAKSDMALVGVLAIFAVFLFPFVGRSADVLGVRKTAAIGVIASPILFFALSRINTLGAYAVLYTLQAAVLVTTTPPVYCRIVVQYFKEGRGLALGIASAGPALAVAVGGPFFNNFITDHGWRSGYLVLAAYTLIGGVIALLMLPPEMRGDKTRAAPRPKRARADYARIFRSAPFWIIFVAILLCSLPQAVMTSQLSLILEENGAAGKAASIMISAYASGMIIGRLVSGVALDRFSARWVATISLALSGLGLLVIASGLDSRPILFFSVLTFGLSVGAESDVVAYLVVRNFGLRLYSSVHSIIATSTAVAAVLGSIMLSLFLTSTSFYAPFLGVTGVLAVFGSLLFLLLPRNPQVEDETEEEEEAAIQAEVVSPHGPGTVAI
jgi:MFS family permease